MIILAVESSSKGVTYWLIDKTKDPNKYSAFEVGDRIILANIQRIASAKFMTLQKRLVVTVYPRAYYKISNNANEKLKGQTAIPV